MIRKHYDKILLAAALVLLLIAFAFSALRPEPRAVTDYVDIPSLRQDNRFKVSDPPELDLAVPEWEPPPAQPAGPEWVFDIFTPPVIYFDAVANVFDVRATGGEPRTRFGVELVEIREDLYRIQLVGYHGRAGEYLINLENVETGEVINAREGREYPQFDLAVRSFRVEREQVEHRGGTPVWTNIAYVVIYDQRLDQEVSLRSDTRRRDERPVAVFRASGDSGQTTSARAGDSFTLGDFTYTVDQIEPPTVTVTREGGPEGEEPETKTLGIVRRERDEEGPPESDSPSGQGPEGGRSPEANEDSPEGAPPPDEADFAM